MTTHPVSLQEV